MQRIEMNGRRFLGGAAVAAAALGLLAGQGCPPAAPQGLPADNQRATFASQCALNVITCTTSWPEAVAKVANGEGIGVEPLDGQTVTATDAGFLVEGSDGNGVEPVQLIGSDSVVGDTASGLSYSWSSGATDNNPCELNHGDEFSTESDPQVSLLEGFHYIRLFVQNDIVRDNVEAQGCEEDAFTNVRSFDWVEIEIEVRD